MDNIVLTPVPLPELLDQLRQIIREEVQAGINISSGEKLISPAEACKVFSPSITRPTLDKLCADGLLVKRYVGARVFFKQSEVIDAAKGYKRYAH